MKSIKRYSLTDFLSELALSILVLLLSFTDATQAQTVVPSPSPTESSVRITKCWAYATNEASDEAITSNGSRVFLGGPAARIEAISLEGKRLWSSDLGGDISSNLLATTTDLFLVTSITKKDIGAGGGSILRSLSSETGVTNWTIKLGESGAYFLGVSSGLVIEVSRAGLIQALDMTNGTLKWKRQLAEGFRSRPVFTSGKVYVASTENQVFGVSTASGEVTLVQKFVYPITAIAAAGDGELVLGDDRGNVAPYSVYTGRAVWKFKSGGEISEILSFNDHILVTSHDNFVYWLLARNGSVVWKKRMAGRITQIADLLNQFTVITSLDDRNTLVADRENGKTVGQIVLSVDETLTGIPVTTNGLILILTNQSAYGYRIDGCGSKNLGGAEQ